MNNAYWEREKGEKLKRSKRIFFVKPNTEIILMQDNL